MQSLKGSAGRSAAERPAVDTRIPFQVMGVGRERLRATSSTAYNFPSMDLAVFWMEPTRARMFPVSALIPVI
jgi:hypothetical protein